MPQCLVGHNAKKQNQTPTRNLVINTYALSRSAIVLIWIYHGLVPKIIFKHSSEMELVAKGPLVVNETTTILLAGLAEVLLGICVLVFWKSSWPIVVSLAAFTLLLIGSIVVSPELAIQAFNPITLTISAIVFCLIQLRERKQKGEAID